METDSVLNMKTVLLGAGNLATSLALSMERCGLGIRQIYSRTPASATRLGERLQADVEVTDRLADLCPDADLYVCALKDDALADALSRMPGFGQGLWVHTSGTLPLSVFQPFTGRAGVFYPLQTFSCSRPVSLDEVPLCLETARVEDMPLLKAFAARLSTRVIELDSAQRGVLHLAAVFANNFTNSLYATAGEILERAGLPFDLLLPLIDETARKVHDLAPAAAQTGPARRMDTKVIDRHLQLLEAFGMEHNADLYRRLTEIIHDRSL